MGDLLRERKAYEQRVAFLSLWKAGYVKTPELALKLGISQRSVDRLKGQMRSPGVSNPSISLLEELIARFDPSQVPEGAIPTTPEDPSSPRPAARELPPDPGPLLDHMSIARRIVIDERLDPRDRIRAVEACERRRQWDIDHGTIKGAVNWALLTLDDIPADERPRLFGLLAETMREARAPFLSQVETTPLQQAVYFALGLVVHQDDAAAVLAELAPARAAALAKAKELGAAREGPPADITPVDPQDYLDHVPKGVDA